MKIDVEKAQAAGWMLSQDKYPEACTEFLNNTLTPPDERINWCALWMEDENGITYPHWIDEEFMIKDEG